MVHCLGTYSGGLAVAFGKGCVISLYKATTLQPKAYSNLKNTVETTEDWATGLTVHTQEQCACHNKYHALSINKYHALSINKYSYLTSCIYPFTLYYYITPFYAATPTELPACVSSLRYFYSLMSFGEHSKLQGVELVEDSNTVNHHDKIE